MCDPTAVRTEVTALHRNPKLKIIDLFFCKKIIKTFHFLIYLYSGTLEPKLRVKLS